VFELDELQSFLNARLDLVFFHVLFAETIGDIFADGHGIEEGAFLKHETDAFAEMQKLFLGHRGNFLAQHGDAATRGFEQTCSEFES